MSVNVDPAGRDDHALRLDLARAAADLEVRAHGGDGLAMRDVRLEPAAPAARSAACSV